MFFCLGCDSDVGSATSVPFVLPVGTSRVEFLRAGGADAGSGLYVKDASGSVLCAAETGTHTDTFFDDSCIGLESFWGEIVHLYLADAHTSGWGNAYFDDIKVVDANGVAVSISQMVTSFTATETTRSSSTTTSTVAATEAASIARATTHWVWSLLLFTSVALTLIGVVCCVAYCCEQGGEEHGLWRAATPTTTPARHERSRSGRTTTTTTRTMTPATTRTTTSLREFGRARSFFVVY